ncbi:MAG: tripartite tricarboxylate transporter substrate binding protein [Rhizobiales bacterium]|nr:tripartite tricarboxylate transporter substrate binding protein [Hyphomicrobiales bacterium]
MSRWKTAILAGLALAVTFVPAHGQTYPERPITLIIPFPPGGSTTIVGRIIADKMSETLGQQIVVDNRGGAGGTIGTRAAAKSTPDGYTILFGYTGTLAVAPSFYPNGGYDPRKDFVPIGRIGMAPSTVVVHPSFQVRTIAELIAYAKANPGKVNYGSAGVGSLNHIAGEYLAAKAGIKLTHVPYKGSGPVMTDLLGGHIPLAFAPIPTVHSNVSSGLLRALAVTSLKRSSLLPDVPTVVESGIPNFEAVLRYGLVAPVGTPPAIIARLNKELNAALATDDVKKRLAVEGAEPLPSTPEEYAADIDREETQWSKVVKDAGVKVEK